VRNIIRDGPEISDYIMNTISTAIVIS